jgi:hypothetical protein
MAKSDGIRSAFEDDDETNDLLSGFAPKPLSASKPSAQSEITEKAVEQVAQKRGFQKRAKPKKKAMRRSQFYQTGRNTQIAVKGRAEDKERIAALCGQQDWVQGQLIEYALDALVEKIADPQSDFWKDRNFEGVD